MWVQNSVWSYVIPWESHVDSCHLRFSCSEFYADFKKIGCHFFHVTLRSFFDPWRSWPLDLIYLFIHVFIKTHVLLVVQHIKMTEIV